MRLKAWLFLNGGWPLCAQILPGQGRPSSATLGIRKLEIGYPIVKTTSFCVLSFWHNTGVWRTVTVGQTDRPTDGFAVAYSALTTLALLRALKLLTIGPIRRWVCLNMMSIWCKFTKVLFCKHASFRTTIASCFPCFLVTCGWQSSFRCLSMPVMLFCIVSLKYTFVFSKANKSICEIPCECAGWFLAHDICLCLVLPSTTSSVKTSELIMRTLIHRTDCPLQRHIRVQLEVRSWKWTVNTAS